LLYLCASIAQSRLADFDGGDLTQELLEFPPGRGDNYNCGGNYEYDCNRYQNRPHQQALAK
jgi:hypothetical protein